MANPFSIKQANEDKELLVLINQGNSDALEKLVKKHQDWIYNIAFRMLGNKEDADDLTQEILIKVIVKLSSFTGKSKFTTWLYRIAVNAIFDHKKTDKEQFFYSLQQYGNDIDNSPDYELADSRYTPQEQQLIEHEVFVDCFLGMLLCLSREQRIIFILSEIFELEQTVTCVILDIKDTVYRKRLQRTREQLSNFVKGRCGLLNENNSCKCILKSKHLIDQGLVNPDSLLFNKTRYQSIKSLLSQKQDKFNDLVSSNFKDLFQEQPFLHASDIAPKIKKIVTSKIFNEIFSLDIH